MENKWIIQKLIFIIDKVLIDQYASVPEYWNKDIILLYILPNYLFRH